MEIIVLDEHHEVLLLWEEALSKGMIKKGSSLLHVDGHADLSIPLLTESVYSKDIVGFTQRQLDIGNFILPAVMRGIFKEIFLLGKSYRRQKEKQRKKKKYYIGSLHGEGIWIKHKVVLNKFTRRLFPDIRPWYLSTRNDPEEVEMKRGVLDIDLDYFYGHYFPQPQIGLRLTKPQRKMLKRLSLSEDKYKIPLKFFDIQDGILKGMNWSEGDLRFKEIIYNDSKEWIEYAISNFIRSLKMKPQLISICRSTKSGYTPKKYAIFAERTLINYLTGKQKKVIDPCGITSSFKIYPFIASGGNTIYNQLLSDTMKLKIASRFIWGLIQEGKNFAQIFKEMSKRYDVEPELLKSKIIKFIFALKNKYIIK